MPAGGPEETEAVAVAVGHAQAHPLLSDRGLPAGTFEARGVEPRAAENNEDEQLAEIAPQEEPFLAHGFAVVLFHQSADLDGQGAEAKQDQQRYEKDRAIEREGEEAREERRGLQRSGNRRRLG